MATTSCPRCLRPVPPGTDRCPSCGTPLPGAAPLPGASRPVGLPRTCVNCQQPMQRTGELAFRVGGYVGGTGMLLGGVNQLAEGLQPFAVYYCQRCGKVDLYYPGT